VFYEHITQIWAFWKDDFLSQMKKIEHKKKIMKRFSQHKGSVSRHKPSHQSKSEIGAI